MMAQFLQPLRPDYPFNEKNFMMFYRLFFFPLAILFFINVGVGCSIHTDPYACSYFGSCKWAGGACVSAPRGLNFNSNTYALSNTLVPKVSSPLDKAK